MTRWTALSFCLLCWQCGWAQNGNETTALHQSIQQRTAQIYDSLLSIRRDLHQHPELGGEEKRTSEFIQQYLLELGMEVKAGIGGYGVLGILQGKEAGKKIAWRADIDALAWDTPERGAFASIKEGVRHICGHDVHTTIALGMANVLASQREHIRGTVYFIFQPSEENYQGAKAMLANGLLDMIAPDEIYAAHISPMPAGMVASKPDYLFADYKQLNITYSDSPQSDSVAAFTQSLVTKLQNVAPDSKFWDTRNLMDPQIGIGNPNTIFKEFVTVNQDFKVQQREGKLTITGFLSASNQQTMDAIPQLLRQQIEQSKYADQLINISFYSDMIGYSPERGNIQNDEDLTPQAISTMSSIYGGASAIPLYGVIPDGRGDDFAYFQEEIPGTYFLLGGSNFEKGIIAMPHTPNFGVDESCIKSGVNYFSSLIMERVND